MSEGVQHGSAGCSSGIVLREMTAGDAGGVAALMSAQRPGYLAHFTPFDMSAAEWRARLAAAEADRYWVILSGTVLAGFCMLRGWDEGYSRPAFGVVVGEPYQGRGLAATALAHCIAWCCAATDATSLMLKVHPDNTAARKVYDAAGFLPEGLCPHSGLMIMTLDLSAQRQSL